ncbi:MAG: hypothetical protein A2156_07025 [Deltaproteobacteria bacterium RBG_16_48_10]|nr:MAG: hypothetical protein A2156_07025 [Deltaproteobacteria bacterium RBG_16_48_10]
MKREELENYPFYPINRKAFGKPDLNRVEAGDHVLVIKDVGRKNVFFRWTLGRWLIHKEWEIYSRLGGIKGIPKATERIDRYAFAMEFISGRPIQRDEDLPLSFFQELERILKEIHARGVVHLDLRHKGNILLSDKREPVLLDFNSAYYFKTNGLLHRYLFPLLRRIDCGGYLKLKNRVSSSFLTHEELNFLKRFNRLRRLWIFN